MATTEDVRRIAGPLPRSYEVVVRDRVKFRVGKIVYLAFSRDETVLGFAFPRAERDAVLAARPEVFLPPDASDLRFQWLQLRMAAVDVDELEELIYDAWRMVVPKKVATAWFDRL